MKCIDCKYHVLVNCYYGMDGFCLHPMNAELTRKSLDGGCLRGEQFTCKECKHLKYYQLSNKFGCELNMKDEFGRKVTEQSHVNCDQFNGLKEAYANMHKFDAKLRELTREDLNFYDGYWWMEETEE